MYDDPGHGHKARGIEGLHPDAHSQALFAFREVPANSSGVQRQTWTSGFALTEGLRMRIWVQNFYPASLMSMARIIVHGYYL